MLIIRVESGIEPWGWNGCPNQTNQEIPWHNQHHYHEQDVIFDNLELTHHHCNRAVHGWIISCGYFLCRTRVFKNIVDPPCLWQDHSKAQSVAKWEQPLPKLGSKWSEIFQCYNACKANKNSDSHCKELSEWSIGPFQLWMCTYRQIHRAELPQ